MASMSKRDYYEVLGVEESASMTTIRAAFREKAKEFQRFASKN